MKEKTIKLSHISCTEQKLHIYLQRFFGETISRQRVRRDGRVVDCGGLENR